MQIKISKNADSYQNSMFKLGNSRTDLTFRAASANLYSEHIAKDMDEAESLLAAAWKDHQVDSQSSEEREAEEREAAKYLRKLTAVCPPLSRRLSQEAVELLQEYMGWSADSRGVFQWFYRLKADGRVWDTCINPIPAMMEKDQGRYNEFQKKWYRLHSAKNIKAWTVFDTEDGLSPLLSDERLLKITKNLLPEEERIKIPVLTERWFLEWAEFDFDPKYSPLDNVPKVPVDMLPNLRELFDPQSKQAWVTTLMKEDPKNLSIEMPATITNSPDQDAFTYVDLKSLVEGPTPAWDKWIQSVHPICREIFMAAVFAPMHEKCRHRKMVWMRSQGYDGKSTFFNALNRFSGGKLTKSFGKHEITSDFGMEGLIGARILLWGDSQHDNALSTNVVHNITGGDLVTINRKNEKAIQYRFNSMMFVASNSRPQIKTWARNETTRMLYIPFIEPKEEVLKEFALVGEDGKVKRHSDGTPMFKGSNLEEELLAEMPHILWKCKEQYKKYCPAPYRDLTVPPKVYDLMLEQLEHEDGNEFASFVAKNLAFAPEFEVSVKDVHDKLKRNIKGANRFTTGEFFRYLEQSYGVEKKKKGARGSQEMKYIGCKLKGAGSDTMFD
jgi:hypothetical protein